MVSFQQLLSLNRRDKVSDFENSSNGKKRTRDDTEAEETPATKRRNCKFFTDLQLNLETPLPSEWQRFLDIQSGQIYFYNTRTQKRTLWNPRASQLATPPSENCGGHMSLDLELNLPCGSLSSVEEENVLKKQNLDCSEQYSDNYSGDAGRSPSLSLMPFSLDVDRQEMLATVCMQCHMLVMLCKSSPACPNCKFMHPPDQSPPDLFKPRGIILILQSSDQKPLAIREKVGAHQPNYDCDDVDEQVWRERPAQTATHGLVVWQSQPSQLLLSLSDHNMPTIPSVSGSRSAIVAALATVWVPAIESAGSSPSPGRSETSDEVLRKAQPDLNRRDSGLTCMGWAPGAKLAASVGGFNNRNPNAKVLTRDEIGVWKTLLPNETVGSAPTPHDSVD
ncbi:hypothetical protein Nepgr_033233 [Nepenthes gracilis]|uniref:WW domain-containing protein n=1 Tax=Nepenthes gracilis TaxID=150966 RepID=A0AAD3TKU5_NEPGR|nr:hypothetical protein Nepgr_033233 [Nepenthes gracilis]